MQISNLDPEPTFTCKENFHQKVKESLNIGAERLVLCLKFEGIFNSFEIFRDLDNYFQIASLRRIRIRM